MKLFLIFLVFWNVMVFLTSPSVAILKKEGLTSKGTFQRNVVLNLTVVVEKKNQFYIYRLTKAWHFYLYEKHKQERGCSQKEFASAECWNQKQVRPEMGFSQSPMECLETGKDESRSQRNAVGKKPSVKSSRLVCWKLARRWHCDSVKFTQSCPTADIMIKNHISWYSIIMR